MNIVNEINLLVQEDKYKNVSSKDLKKEYPDKIIDLEEILINYMGEKDHQFLKTGFLDKWNFLTKKSAYPFEYFNGNDDCQKPVNNLKNEHFFSKLKTDYPIDEEIQRTREIIKNLNIKNGVELTRKYLKSDVLFLPCVFENFIKVSVNEFCINPLYCVSLPGYTWQGGLKFTGTNSQTLQDNDMILLLENNFRGVRSS